MAVYSLQTSVLSLAGSIVTGAGEGGFLEVTHDSERWENVKCVDGEVVSCQILDRSATATLTLRYGSPTNNLLQRLAALGIAFPFFFQTVNGDYLATDECRVQKLPDMSYGQKPGDQQWTLFLNNVDVQFGFAV